LKNSPSQNVVEMDTCLDNVTESSQIHYVVAYAKITVEKSKDVTLNGVYFGGITTNHEEAELIATQCINNAKGGTIIPRIVTCKTPLIIDGLYEAQDKFEKLIEEMREANMIYFKKK